jgi:hypothetical protein
LTKADWIAAAIFLGPLLLLLLWQVGTGIYGLLTGRWAPTGDW